MNLQQTEGAAVRYDYNTLLAFAQQLTTKAGLPADRAAVVAEVLLEADLMGHTTHGLSQLPGTLKNIETGAVRKEGEAPLKVGLYGAGESADDDGDQSWKIFALDKRTGKVLWDRTAHTGVPRARRHTKATHANTTVATDGKRIVAFFGSEGLYAYDLDGKLLWKKDLGLLEEDI